MDKAFCYVAGYGRGSLHFTQGLGPADVTELSESYKGSKELTLEERLRLAKENMGPVVARSMGGSGWLLEARWKL